MLTLHAAAWLLTHQSTDPSHSSKGASASPVGSIHLAGPAQAARKPPSINLTYSALALRSSILRVLAEFGWRLALDFASWLPRCLSVVARIFSDVIELPLGLSRPGQRRAHRRSAGSLRSSSGWELPRSPAAAIRRLRRPRQTGHRGLSEVRTSPRQRQ